MRRLEERAEAAFPDPPRTDPASERSRGALTSPYPQPRYRRNGHEERIAWQDVYDAALRGGRRPGGERGAAAGRAWLTALRVRLTELAPFTAEIVAAILGFPAS